MNLKTICTQDSFENGLELHRSLFVSVIMLMCNFPQSISCVSGEKFLDTRLFHFDLKFCRGYKTLDRFIISEFVFSMFSHTLVSTDRMTTVFKSDENSRLG